MGAEVLLVLLLALALVTVAGGLLIRGQGAAVRGPRFWLGMGLMLAGSIPFVYALLILF